MSSAMSTFTRDSSFDAFLFAQIGAERNGMALSVLSALARLELDPWTEAASLSELSASAATERLTSLLAPSPSSQLPTPAPATITRLVGLLPALATDKAGSPGATAAAKSNPSWPVYVYFILAFATMYAQELIERRDNKVPFSGVASPAASALDPGPAKAARE